MNKIVTLGFILFVSVIFSGVVSAAGLADSPQPKFRHDINNTGQSQYNGPQTNNTKWEYHTGVESEVSSPTIGLDGTIYFGSHDNNLYALNPNGTLKWKYKTGNSVGSSPTIGSNNTIYFGSWDHNLYALNPNGTLKWKYTTGGQIFSSPAIGLDGTIYFGSWDQNLYALNPNGTKKWKYLTGNIVDSSPAISIDGIIYFGSFDHNFYALNKNGTLKWKYTALNTIDSSPAIGKDGTIYFGSHDNNLYALNKNGTLKWKYTTNYHIYSSPAISLDGTIYFGSYDNKLYALNPNGTLKWKYTTGGQIFSSPAIGLDGIIYFGSFDHNFYALNKNGTLKWKYTSDEYIDCSPSIGSDSSIYWGSWEGELYSIQDKLSISATPSSGTYNNTIKIVLKMNRPGTIYYTLNGTNPTTSSNKYSIPIIIFSNKTLKYFGMDLAKNKSNIYTQVYKVNDTTKPTISSINPLNGATNVPVNKVIKIIFSEPIKAGSNYIEFKNSNGTTIPYTTNISGNIFTITPKNNLTEDKYTLILHSGCVTDLAGNTLALTSSAFSVGTSPIITSSNPANSATGVARNKTITITFNEAVKWGTKNIQMQVNGATYTAYTINLSSDGKTLTIKPTSLWAANTTYNVILHTGCVKDYAGNSLALTSRIFKTGA